MVASFLSSNLSFFLSSLHLMHLCWHRSETRVHLACQRCCLQAGRWLARVLARPSRSSPMADSRVSPPFVVAAKWNEGWRWRRGGGQD